ncbi:hypothetical protein R9208_10835 [Flammeovirgaceae bacterium SG7u.132]|nr:hypothetical protein [Flammeovirgaceae bacterium SG7u.132]
MSYRARHGISDQSLPELIDFGSGNTIQYRYDAAGVKLQKKVFENGVPVKVTDYLGGFHYEEDTLRFVHTAEGRALWKTDTQDLTQDFVYEYHYKDHLGNLRMSVREGDEKDVFLATSELDMQDYEEEQLGFENIKLTQNTEVTAKSGSVSSLVRNAEGYQLPVGPFKQFEVGKGDAIDASVFVKYLYDANQANNESTLPIGSTMQNTFVPDGGSSPISLGFGISSLGNKENANDEPAAYIKVEVYNQDGELMEDQTQTRWVSGLGGGGWHGLNIYPEIKIGQDGYAKVYVANESKTKVWFDDLQITHKKGIIAQENHYYPFGMNMAGIERNGIPEFMFQFNGMGEKETDFGLAWTMTPFRPLDTQLGRFWGIDQLADLMPSINPMAYAFNNPIKYNDPLGLMGTDPDPVPDPECPKCGLAPQNLPEVTVTSGYSRSTIMNNPIYRNLYFHHKRGDNKRFNIMGNENNMLHYTKPPDFYASDFMKGIKAIATRGNQLMFGTVGAAYGAPILLESLPALSTGQMAIETGTQLTVNGFNNVLEYGFSSTAVLNTIGQTDVADIIIAGSGLGVVGSSTFGGAIDIPLNLTGTQMFGVDKSFSETAIDTGFGIVGGKAHNFITGKGFQLYTGLANGSVGNVGFKVKGMSSLYSDIWKGTIELYNKGGASGLKRQTNKNK